MEWTKTFIAQKTITGTLVDFFSDHIVKVRKHKVVGKNAIYDLYCKSAYSQGNLTRETSIKLPVKLIDPDIYEANEELAWFRRLAEDGEITEDMLDSSL